MGPREPRRADDTDERIVDAIREAPMPVVNTHYLVHALDRPDGEVVEHLERLVEEGVIDHREVEGRGHLWWLAPRYERGRDRGGDVPVAARGRPVGQRCSMRRTPRPSGRPMRGTPGSPSATQRRKVPPSSVSSNATMARPADVSRTPPNFER